jgi:hypothetical protein
MAHVTHVSTVEAQHHEDRARSSEQHTRAEDGKIRHPHTNKVVGRWHSYAPGEVEETPHTHYTQYHPHGRSYSTKKAATTAHLSVEGRHSAEGRKNHAKEIGSVLEKDYGKKVKVTHGPKGSTVYLDRPGTQGISKVARTHYVPRSVYKKHQAKETAEMQAKAKALPSGPAHPEMEKAHALVRHHYDKAESADRRSRRSWKKWRGAGTKDGGVHEKAQSDLKQAVAGYHNAVDEAHATAKKLGVHAAHGFTPQKDIKNGSEAKTRKFRSILGHLHGAHRGRRSFHLNPSPHFHSEDHAKAYELALHRHLAGRPYRTQGTDYDYPNKKHHSVTWSPTPKKRGKKTKAAATQAEWRSLSRSALLLSSVGSRR